MSNTTQTVYSLLRFPYHWPTIRNSALFRIDFLKDKININVTTYNMTNKNSVSSYILVIQLQTS